MTETIIHIVDGKIVLNPEPEPMLWKDNPSDYNKALAKWKKNCIPCENGKRMQPEIGAITAEGYECMEKSEIMWFVVIDELWEYITPGQKVLAEGNTVRKIV